MRDRTQNTRRRIQCHSSRQKRPTCNHTCAVGGLRSGLGLGLGFSPPSRPAPPPLPLRACSAAATAATPRPAGSSPAAPAVRRADWPPPTCAPGSERAARQAAKRQEHPRRHQQSATWNPVGASTHENDDLETDASIASFCDYLETECLSAQAPPKKFGQPSGRSWRHCCGPIYSVRRLKYALSNHASRDILRV